MHEAINFDPSILEGVSELNLICIDDVDLISKRGEWEIALFNLINECYENFFYYQAALISLKQFLILSLG